MATSGIVSRYWDSGCFIGILNGESQAEACKKIIDDAKEGKTLLYVSPIVQLEVIRPRGSGSPIPKADKERVQELFENDYIKWRMIDRAISTLSQELCWDHDLHPRDALHLACTLDLKCDLLETFDPDLQKWDGKIPTCAGDLKIS